MALRALISFDMAIKDSEGIIFVRYSGSLTRQTGFFRTAHKSGLACSIDVTPLSNARLQELYNNLLGLTISASCVILPFQLWSVETSLKD